jgi:superfamily I DNA/RNA helicase
MPLPKPRGKQVEVLALRPDGHVVVLGTAGSGKTVLALLRAAYLSHPSAPHGGKTLLLCFNKALANYLRTQRDPTLSRVTIEHYHLFARGYLNSRGKMPRHGCICEPTQRSAFISAAAIEVARHRGQADIATLAQRFSEEIAWIARQGYTRLNDYVDSGGGFFDHAADREVVWEVRSEYLTRRSESGLLYDWDDLASTVIAELACDSSSRRYKHIVIDEGQDFSPEMIRSLVLAVQPGGSITFFADMAQQIYGRNLNWRAGGLEVDAPWLFQENYRNTKQIAKLALSISQMPYYADAADLVEPHDPTADGPLPVLVEAGTAAREAEFVAEQAIRFGKNQSVGVFVMPGCEWLFQRHLPREAVQIDRNLSRWPQGPGIRYGTINSAKGLEFDLVILPSLGAATVPDPKFVHAVGPSAAAERDGRLLYIGVSRARARLVLTYSGSLTTLLPAEWSLYQGMKL